MADTRTLGNMIDRIEDELSRTDLTIQISDAIRSAIQHYQTERLWFLETTNFTLTTSSSLEFYALPDGFQSLDNIDIVIGGNRLPLYQKTYAEISDKQTGNSFGQPYEFAIYGSDLYLFPIPNDAYPIILDYLDTLDSISATTSTNAFTTFGEEMIRARARADIEINILRDERALAEFDRVGPAGYYSIRERIAHERLVRRGKRHASANTLMGSGVY